MFFLRETGFVSFIMGAVILVAGGLFLSAGAQSAVEQVDKVAPGLFLQLNKLEDRDNACRVYLLVSERGGDDLQKLDADMVLLDKEGIIIKRYLVPLAPLKSQTTRVRLFDLPGSQCGDIRSILFNGVVACVPATAQACMEVDLDSKADNVSLFE